MSLAELFDSGTTGDKAQKAQEAARPPG
jgi:hypothetical protein